MAGKKRPVAAQVAERKNPKRAGAKPTPEQSAQSNLAKRIRARWGSSREQLPLDRLETDLAGSRRRDIVVALKELEKAGLGEFSVDPEGHSASFVWIKRKPLAPAPAPPAAKTRPKAAVVERRASVQWQHAPKRLSQQNTASAAAASSAGSAPELLPHTFHVRPEVAVTFHLPEDVTRAEIERLCLSLQALPLR